MNVQVNPIILIKSTKIAKSEEDRDFFHKVISSLKVSDLDHLKKLGVGTQQSLVEDRSKPLYLIKCLVGLVHENQGWYPLKTLMA